MTRACGSLWLGMAVLAAFAGFPRDVRACSPLPCSSALVAPANGGVVPANVPALPFRPGYGWLFNQIPTALFALEAQDGTVIPVDVVAADPDTLVVPKALLTEGTWYTLRYPEGCPNPNTWMQPEQPLQASLLFLAGAASPLPSEPPTLSVSQLRTDQVDAPTSKGSCTEPIRAAMAFFYLDVPGASGFEVVAWQETRVDGVRWTLTPPGYGLASFAAGMWVRNPLMIYAGCPPLDPEDDNGLALGTHQVEVRYVIPGLDPPLATATTTVVLACDPLVAETSPEPGAEPAPEPAAETAPVETAATEDVLSPDPAVATDVSPDTAADAQVVEAVASSSGCSSGPGSPGAGWLAAVLGAFIALRAAAPSPTAPRRPR